MLESTMCSKSGEICFHRKHFCRVSYDFSTLTLDSLKKRKTVAHNLWGPRGRKQKGPFLRRLMRVEFMCKVPSDVASPGFESFWAGDGKCWWWMVGGIEWSGRRVSSARGIPFKSWTWAGCAVKFPRDAVLSLRLVQIQSLINSFMEHWFTLVRLTRWFCIKGWNGMALTGRLFSIKKILSGADWS